MRAWCWCTQGRFESTHVGFFCVPSRATHHTTQHNTPTTHTTHTTHTPTHTHNTHNTHTPQHTQHTILAQGPSSSSLGCVSSSSERCRACLEPVFAWCRACLEPVSSMADGATRWLASAVRTLQKRVEFLEAAVSSGRAPTSVSTQTSTLSSCTSPMQESGLDRTSTVSSAMTRVKDPVDENASFSMLQQKVVSEFDISDLNPRGCSQNFTGELDYENCTMCKRRKVVSEFDISDLNPRVCSQNFTGELD